MNKFIKNPFVNLQKDAMTALCIVLAGCLISCTSKSEVDENVTDPETTILGKWELFQAQLGYNEYPQTPKGYVEYFHDGSFAWYDNSTKVYTLFEEKYWLDDSYELPGPGYIMYEHRVDEGLVLHYGKILKEVEYATGVVETKLVGPNFPDKPHGNQFHLNFLNLNTIRFESLDLSPITGPSYLIYKRKK